MCIICNTNSVEIADEFLTEFAAAQRHMKAATIAMLKVSNAATTPEHRKRYDSIHKKMTRQIREWNKLEEKREHFQ